MKAACSTIAARIAIAFAVVATPLSASAADVAKLIDVQKIWGKAPHSAFTDLVRFNDQFYVAFREANTHVVPPVGQPGGDLRILRSPDGVKWTTAAVIVGGINRDLRDAKLAVTPDNRLMMSGARADHAAPSTRQSMTWFSVDGSDWSEPYDVGDPNYWLWGTTWNDDQAYSIGYGPVPDGIDRWTARLYRSDDGVDFETLAPTLSSQSGLSEGSLLFRRDGTALALIRRDAASQIAVIGTSEGDFSQWSWKESNISFGGPELIELPDGRIIAGGRRYDGGHRTSLNFLDPQAGVLTEILRLPSSGDSSYPGMVWFDDRLWVSYYSSHEGKASIYVAQVEFVKDADLPPTKHGGSTTE